MTKSVFQENKSFLDKLFLIVGVIFLIWAVSNLLGVLSTIMLSAFLAVAINPLVNFYSQNIPRAGRGAGIVLAVFTFFLFIGFVFALVLPPFFNQVVDLVQSVPDKVNELSTNEGFVGDFLRDNNIDEKVNDLKSLAIDNFDNITDTVGPIFAGVISSLSKALVMFILVLMMLGEGPQLSNRFWKSYKNKNKEKHRENAEVVYEIITNYVTGQIIVAMIFAFATFVVTTALKVPYSLSISVFVGMFSLIPSIGATVGAFFGVLFGLILSGPAIALVLGIFFIIYQQIENATIQPTVQSKALGLTTLEVFITALIGGAVGGIVGAFVFLPFVAAAKHLVIDWAVRNNYINKIEEAK